MKYSVPYRDNLLPFPSHRLTGLMVAIFFPRVILYNFFLFLPIYGGLGFLGCGVILGFWGWGFQLMGFGACGVGPSGFFGLGLYINIKE